MRHGVKTSKLQRNASHRRALLANQACSLILNGRITTTLAKAKALRPYVEKLITLAKRGDVHSRRLATPPFTTRLPSSACLMKSLPFVRNARAAIPASSSWASASRTPPSWP